MSDETKPQRSTRDHNIKKSSSPIHLEIENEDETISNVNSNSNDERSNYQKPTTSYDRKKKKVRQHSTSTINPKHSAHDVRKSSRHMSIAKSFTRINKENPEEYEVDDFEESNVLSNQNQSDDEEYDENHPLNLKASQSSRQLQHQLSKVNMTQKHKLNPNSRQAKENHYRTKSSGNVGNSSASLQINSMLDNQASGYQSDKKILPFDMWAFLLVFISYFFLISTFPFSLCACVKIAQEYERAVIFRIGRILPGGTAGPGIFFILPCIDTYIKVDLRTVTFDVPPQEILTRDSVTVSVDAVVYFRIFNATISVINVEDAAKSTKLLAASTLRNILGTKSLHEILSDRESVAISIQSTLDDATGPWGVKVERVEVKDVRLPVQLQRAMATEAEAAREARAKVIAAEGEQNASSALRSAAEVISQSPIAIQLRYLQTLTQIASEKNSTIVFPVPLEMLSFLANKDGAIIDKTRKSSPTVEKF